MDRGRAEPGDSANRAVSEPTSQLPTVGQAAPADRTTGAVRAVGSNGVPGGGPTGAERLWRVEIACAWRRRGAFPFTWRFGAYAPTTLATGTW